MPDQPSVAPHHLEAERSVLGAILLDSRHLVACSVDERLKTDDFYRENHANVYKAMLSLYEEDRPIDVLTVTERMREHGTAEADTAMQIEELAGWVPAAGHAREYARLVKKASVARQVLTTTYEVQAGIHDGMMPVDDLIAFAETKLLELGRDSGSDLMTLEGAMDGEFERLADIRAGKEVVGTSTGFIDLDKITAGLQPGNLVILAARPSMGKSALAVDIGRQVAAAGTTVALFSLEMSKDEILRRMIAAHCRVPGDRLLRGPISESEWDRLKSGIFEVVQWPMYVDEGADPGVTDIRAKVRRLSQRRPVGLVVVDYLQLMRGDSMSLQNRNLEIGQITRGLKLLAREAKVPVIALSQLSRAVEQRGDKRPILSDLRDSGSVEQDADLVWFLYRDDYYNDDSEEPGVTEVNIAKHRNGAVGRIKLTFVAKYPKFANHVDGSQFESAPLVGQSGDPIPF